MYLTSWNDDLLQNLHYLTVQIPTHQVTSEVEVCEGSGDAILVVAMSSGLMKKRKRLEADSKMPARAKAKT